MTPCSETSSRAGLVPVSHGQPRSRRRQTTFCRFWLRAFSLCVLQAGACKQRGGSKLYSSSTNIEVTYFPGWSKEEPWKELQLSESHFLLGVSLGVAQFCTMLEADTRAMLVHPLTPKVTGRKNERKEKDSEALDYHTLRSPDCSSKYSQTSKNLLLEVVQLCGSQPFKQHACRRQPVPSRPRCWMGNHAKHILISSQKVKNSQLPHLPGCDQRLSTSLYLHFDTQHRLNIVRCIPGKK